MSFRLFLIVMALSSIAAWIGFVFVVHSIDPTQAGFVGFILFFLSAFIALLGTLVFFGTLIRAWARPQEVLFRQTIRAFRHAFIFSGLFLSTLFLLSMDVLRWWSGLLIILFFSFIELMFVSKRKSNVVNQT